MRCSLVFIDPETNKVASHIGAQKPDGSNIEIGTAITWPLHQRKGLNKELFKIQLAMMRLRGLSPWAFTDKIFDASGNIVIQAQSEKNLEVIGLTPDLISNIDEVERKNITRLCPDVCPFNNQSKGKGYSCHCKKWIPSDDLLEKYIKHLNNYVK